MLSPRCSDSPGVPVVEAVLGQTDEDVFRPDTEWLQLVDHGSEEQLFDRGAVHMDGCDPDDQQVLAIDAVVAGVELDLASVMRLEHLEPIVCRDAQRLDLCLVDRESDLLMGRVEDLAGQVDLNERHGNHPSVQAQLRTSAHHGVVALAATVAVETLAESGKGKECEPPSLDRACGQAALEQPLEAQIC